MLELRDRKTVLPQSCPPGVGVTTRLRRVVVISDDSVAGGGAASLALASLRLLSQRGLRVTLLTGDEGSNPELARWGIDVVPLGGRHIMAGDGALSAARGIFDRTVSKVLARWISLNDSPGTIYHLHNWHKVLSPSAFMPLRRVSDRFFISAHDFFQA
jgi:hypothetical protein